MTLTGSRRTAALTVAAAGLLYLAGALLLPKGLPVEVLVPGVLTGGLTAFTALALVLVYRSARVVNFAQANIGGFCATLVVLLVGVRHWSYWIAVPAGLVVALMLGAWVERGLLGPLRDAPRLILTVATIGVAQLFGAFTLFITGNSFSVFGWTVPNPFEVPTQTGAVVTFRAPIKAHFNLGSLLITSDYLAALVLIPLVLLGLSYFFNRTDAGIGARGAADSGERALLLGIPIRRLSMLTWMVAAALSALGAVLTAGINGFQSNTPVGPESLIAPLAAAVIAGFDSLVVAFVASIALGVVEHAISWNFSDSSLIDLVMFLIIVGALLLRRRTSSRVGGGDVGGFVGVGEARPLPPAVAALPEVRFARIGGLLLLVAGVTLGPLLLRPSQLTFLAFVAIFVVIAASLLILTGWGGQVSLGQFGFVGLGAGSTAFLLGHHVSMVLCLVLSAVVGLASAVLMGLPALRIRGTYLAIVTLAFAAPASTFFLSSSRFPHFAPIRITPPLLFGRFDLSQPKPFFYLCLVFVFIALGIVRNFRRSRFGRAAIALRDNERFAAAVSLSETRVKLATFGLSGSLAGLAGSLYVIALGGIPFAGFAPVFSLSAFTMVVVGGMGSVWGAVLGAVFVYGSQYFLGATALLLTTGGGIVAILSLAPGGLADLSYRLRDRLIGLLLRRRGLPTNFLFSRFDDEIEELVPESGPVAVPVPSVADALLSVRGLEAGYGHLQILFGVDTEVQDAEIFALLGTNGAGKSTILKVIAGLLPAQGGALSFAGEDITKLSPAERVSRGIVLVPGGRGVFGTLTVAENLRLAGWLARRRGDHVFLDETLSQIYELFPVLAERRNQKAGLMSGGEQQMLTIAQALLCKPRLLMIDELSLGLAPAVVGTLLGVIRQLNADGLTIVLVEQSMNVAADIAPRAVFLEKGQVRFAGATKELASQSALVRSVFFTEDREPARAEAGAADSQPAGTAEVVLAVRGLNKSFGGVTAVRDVDLQLTEGTILGVIGANGAGKTTLFDIICGFLGPDSGQVLLNGADISRLPAAERFALGLGRTFQDLRLVPSLTVVETLKVARERHIDVREPLATAFALPEALRSEAKLGDEVDQLVETYNLQRFANSFVSELSTGTRRIVELAAIAAHRPRVLVLDEPSSGLAQKEAEAMVPVLLNLRRTLGATIAIIEHDIPMIKNLSDEIVCMHLGGVLAKGSAAEVLSNPAVISSYLGVDEVTVDRSDERPPRPTTKRRPAVASA